MYESVRGRLLVREATRCVVEAGGLGYSIAVPLSTAERLATARLGDEVFLKLHLAVPERGGEWRIFGFSTDEERELFRAALSVSGVGPATALALVSGMPARELRAAVASGDAKALSRIKGVGKKTAERLVVELRDAFAAPTGPGGGAAVPGPLADAVAALVALGLDPSEAADRLRRIPDAERVPVADLVRRALRSGG